MNKKITKRGKTKKFVLNEDFIFGAPRCLRCGKVLKSNEMILCNNCKDRRIF